MGSRRTAVPAVTVAAVTLAAGGGCASSLSSAASSAPGTIAVSASSCAAGWVAPHAGRTTFTVRNNGQVALSVQLVSAVHDGVYGALATIGPGTSQPVTAVLPSGEYQWRCLPFGNAIGSTSTTGRVTGRTTLQASVVYPLTSDEAEAATLRYRAEVEQRLPALLTAARALDAAVRSGDRAAAQERWRDVATAYAGLGGAYGAFGKYDAEIDGGAHGLPHGVHDRHFTGLHRIELLLWHGDPVASATPYTARLVTDIAALQHAFPRLRIASADLPVRAHEILEDALRDQLTGETDYGSRDGVELTAADVTGTRLVLDALTQSIAARSKPLLRNCRTALSRLSHTVDGLRSAGGAWPAPGALSLADRQRLDGAVDRAVDVLSALPGVLPIEGGS